MDKVQLTKAEEQMMRILWGKGSATVQQALEGFEDPKPARTTVATVLTILENKGFVSREMVGKNNVYQPILQKEAYSKAQLFGVMRNYFNNSFASMASFFAKENNLTINEMDTLIEDIKKELQNR